MPLQASTIQDFPAEPPIGEGSAYDITIPDHELQTPEEYDRRAHALFCAERGFERDQVRALRLFHVAADKLQEAEVSFDAGLTFSDGEELFFRDLDFARENFIRAAQLGDVSAMIQLGSLFCHGENGFPADLLAAQEWYRRAARRGHVSATFEFEILRQGNTQRVKNGAELCRRLYIPIADKRDDDAMWRLATVLHHGTPDIVQDPLVAAKWYELVAIRSEVRYRVQVYLQVCLRGTPLDPGLTEKRQRDIGLRAMYQLAVLRHHGAGDLAKNIASARAWYEDAARFGYLSAINALGALLLQGTDGVQRDAVAAKEWFQKSSDAGDTTGMRHLGRLLIQGCGGEAVPKQVMVGIELLERAVELGNAAAMVELSELLMTGDEGVKRDVARAQALLENAVSAGGGPHEKIALARMLVSERLGAEHNPVRSAELLKSAFTEAPTCPFTSEELQMLRPKTQSGDVQPDGQEEVTEKKAKATRDGTSEGFRFPRYLATDLCDFSRSDHSASNMMAYASVRSKTCLLLTLGGGGRGKTCTVNSIRGMKFVKEHIPTEMASVSRFIAEEGRRGDKQIIDAQLDLIEKYVTATANRPFERAAAESSDQDPKEILTIPNRIILGMDAPALVRCWDMGGQSQYEMTHPLFISRGEILMFVVDLQRVSIKATRESEVEILCHWMQLAYSSVPDPSRTRIVIVGTHEKDSRDDALQLLRECLQRQLGDAVYNSWIRQSGQTRANGDDGVFVAIENKEAERDPAGSGLERLERVVKRAAHEVLRTRGEVPLRWLTLMDKLDRRPEKFMSKEELEEVVIGMSEFERDDDKRNKDVLECFRCMASMGRVVLFELEEEEYYVFLDVDSIIDLIGRVTASDHRLRCRMSKDDIEKLNRGRISRRSLFQLWEGYDEKGKELVLNLLCRHDLLMMLESNEESRQSGSCVIGVPALLPCGWDDFKWSRGPGEKDLEVTTKFEDAVPNGLVGRLMAHLHRTLGSERVEQGLFERLASRFYPGYAYNSIPPCQSDSIVVRANAALVSLPDGSRVFVGFEVAKRKLCWKFRGRDPVEVGRRSVLLAENMLEHCISVQRKHFVCSDCGCGSVNSVVVELTGEWLSSGPKRALPRQVVRCQECRRPWTSKEVLEDQLDSSEPAGPTLEPVATRRLYHVFISHASPDKLGLARPIFQALWRHGVHCFLDMEELKISSDTAPTLMERAMGEAKIGIFILSPEFVARRWTMKEMRHFLGRSAGNHGDERPVLLPVFSSLSIGDCFSVWDEERKLLEESGFFDAVRQAECSTAQAKRAMREITEFSGVEVKRIGGGKDLTTAEVADEVVERVLKILSVS